MKRKVIAFDLDDTLAISKMSITVDMAESLKRLLDKYEVCVISGCLFERFKLQVVDILNATPEQLSRLHIMPTCGTRYYTFDKSKNDWQLQYSEDLSDDQKIRAAKALEEATRALDLWEAEPYGEIIEDRTSQITLSALGQNAPADKKYEWDPTGEKKRKIRDYVAPMLPDLEVRVAGTTSIDVTIIGLDKSHGMNKLMEKLQIDKKDILYIGNNLQEGGNDYPVKAMGIDTIAVEKWQDTIYVIEGILGVSE